MPGLTTSGSTPSAERGALTLFAAGRGITSEISSSAVASQYLFGWKLKLR